MLQFADDIPVLTESGEELIVILKEMEDILDSRYAMKINKNKIKVFVESRHGISSELTH